MKREVAVLAACLTLGAIIFSINLGGYDLWPPDEPRYALVAREMLDSGDYLTPRVNNQPYKEKPPLLFWLIASLSGPMGEVSPWSTRLPSVLAALATLLFTYLLARDLFTVRVALWSVLILLSMQRFWWNARCGQIDMLLTACLTAGWYGYWRWEQKRQWFWLAWFYASMAAGLYAKGPGVLVFPVLFVLAWSWPSPNRRSEWAHLVIGCCLCVFLYALWAVPAHIGFAREAETAAAETLTSNMLRQTVGRFLLGVSHANWPWYYLKTLPVDWLPWTLFLPWVALWVWRHRRDGNSMRFVLCWAVPAFIFFSIAVGKRAVYLLPLFPAFAILFAAGILHSRDELGETWRRRLYRLYGAILCILGLAPLVVLATPYHDIWSAGLALFGISALIYGILLIFQAHRGQTARLHIHVAASFVLLSALAALFVLPAVNTYKSARDFCAPIRELADAQIDFDLYTVGFAREEYVFYSRHFMTELYTEMIPLQSEHDMSLLETARFQRDFAKAIGKAVEDVKVMDTKVISNDELDSLQKAIHAVADKKDYSPHLIEDFRSGLEKVSDEFFKVFDSPKPAFLYVQENDWRWIYAIHPDIHGAIVLDRRRVGSREVLLVANPAGAALVRERM